MHARLPLLVVFHNVYQQLASMLESVILIQTFASADNVVASIAFWRHPFLYTVLLWGFSCAMGGWRFQLFFAKKIYLAAEKFEFWVISQMALSPFEASDLPKPANVTNFLGQNPVNQLTFAYISRLGKSFKSFIVESNLIIAEQAKEIKKLRDEMEAKFNTVCLN